jgi:hypothetical protein
LYSTLGVLQAIGIGDRALASGRRSGHLHPIYHGQRAFYRGAELIAWFAATGTEARPRQVVDGQLRDLMEA